MVMRGFCSKSKTGKKKENPEKPEDNARWYRTPSHRARAQKKRKRQTEMYKIWGSDWTEPSWALTIICCLGITVLQWGGKMEGGGPVFFGG